jgi:hypothetical protein
VKMGWVPEAASGGGVMGGGDRADEEAAGCELGGVSGDGGGEFEAARGEQWSKGEAMPESKRTASASGMAPASTSTPTASGMRAAAALVADAEARLSNTPSSCTPAATPDVGNGGDRCFAVGVAVGGADRKGGVAGFACSFDASEPDIETPIA